MELIDIINSLIKSRLPIADCKKVLNGLELEDLDQQLDKIIADNTKILFTSLEEQQRSQSRILLSKLVLFKD